MTRSYVSKDAFLDFHSLPVFPVCFPLEQDIRMISILNWFLLRNTYAKLQALKIPSIYTLTLVVAFSLFGT